MSSKKNPNRAFKYSDYQPEGYSMPYSLMPIEGQGVYIDGMETEYKDVWTTGDARVRDKNAYMEAMAQKQAGQQSVQNTQDAEKWFANPENQKKLEPGYIDPDATFNLANLQLAAEAKAKADEPMIDPNGLVAYLARGMRTREQGLRNHQQNADFARAFFDLKRENGTYNSDSLKDLKLK